MSTRRAASASQSSNHSPGPLLEPAWLSESLERRAFRESVRRWFRREGRDLPWRKRRTLYRVWVSEIMLQQTQVATVLNYYQRFLRRFPSVPRLAQAEPQHVLRLWEGLGYYRRARNLQLAAQQVVERHGGRVPRRRQELEQLPGIGRYTAAAILSFALDQPHPILEANTRRLYRRLLGDPSAGNSDRRLWEFAERLLPRKGLADWNDALIDIGATRCTPRLPDCDHCPVVRWCGAKADGLAEIAGQGAARPEATALREVAIVVESEDRVAMRQRREDEWWSGLWDFVRIRVGDEAASRPASGQVSKWVQDETALAVEQIAALPPIRHTVTRYKIRLDCFRACAAGTKPGKLANGYRWVAKSELDDLPLTAPARKLAKAIASNPSF